MPDGTLRLPLEQIASFHPAADIFPLMTGEPFADLVADIKKHGLLHPIIEVGHAILDGRNRYRACIEAGVPIKTVKYTGKDPVGYVLACNLHRRHLNESQRAMVAAKLANLGHGQRADRPANLQVLAVTQPEAAKLLGVSPRSVADAKAVRDRGVPELVARVENGSIAVSLAAKLTDLSSDAQREIAADPDSAGHAVKHHRRAEREQGIAAATRKASAEIGTKQYGVIYADPPWRFEPYSRVTGLDRAADNHYPTMTIADIRALKVPAAEDCVLFLWATVPMLPEALSVMEAWGFEYKSHCVWAKDRTGTGYWFRNAHELLLVGTRGSVPAPAPGSQYGSFHDAAVNKHSRKPAIFSEMIEDMFPNAALLEMFARGPRAGWDVWGNEAS